MKTGAKLIKKERKEQIEIHGFSIEQDQDYTKNELIKAALFAINPNQFEWPYDWDNEFRTSIMNKQLLDRLVVAGAFIAAEIDRMLNSDKV